MNVDIRVFFAALAYIAVFNLVHYFSSKRHYEFVLKNTAPFFASIFISFFWFMLSYDAYFGDDAYTLTYFGGGIVSIIYGFFLYKFFTYKPRRGW